MSYQRNLLACALVAAVLFGDINFEWSASPEIQIGLATPAEARIGHPLTPLSYAGVARRTTRRVVRRTEARLSVLPAGCVYGPYYGGYYYRCGSLYYAKEGGVYVQVIVE